tara:strand:- start:1615 stop:1734 length:120 start_codon:yes stop_codon:yes gene_type:complete
VTDINVVYLIVNEDVFKKKEFVLNAEPAVNRPRIKTTLP